MPWWLMAILLSWTIVSFPLQCIFVEHIHANLRSFYHFKSFYGSANLCLFIIIDEKPLCKTAIRLTCQIRQVTCLLPFNKYMDIFCVADLNQCLVSYEIFQIFSLGAILYQFSKHSNVYLVCLINLGLISIPHAIFGMSRLTVNSICFFDSLLASSILRSRKPLNVWPWNFYQMSSLVRRH